MEQLQNVADHIPLKQGLRLVLHTSLESDPLVADHIPFKQGLRPLKGHLINTR